MNQPPYRDDPSPLQADPQPPLPVEALAADQCVEIDTPCRLCQYNLKSLRLDARCPECGTAVALSVRGDLLSNSDPGWVVTLQTGVRLMLAGWAVVILEVAHLYLAARRPHNVTTDLVLSCVSGVLGWSGLWLASRPDPSGLGEERYGRWRRTVRVAVALEAVGGVIGWMLMVGAAPAVATLPLHIAQSVLGAAGVVAMVAVLRYIALLAVRIPDRALERSAPILSWPVAVAFGYVQLLTAVLRLVGPAALRRHRWFPLFMLSGLLAYLAAALLTLAFLALLGWLNWRLGQAAARARASWRQGEST